MLGFVLGRLPRVGDVLHLGGVTPPIGGNAVADGIFLSQVKIDAICTPITQLYSINLKYSHQLFASRRCITWTRVVEML